MALILFNSCVSVKLKASGSYFQLVVGIEVPQDSILGSKREPRLVIFGKCLVDEAFRDYLS